MSTKDWLDKDYYRILGVAKDAKPDQIKKAFHKIARDNHPDQHPGDKAAEQRFKDATEAYDVLGDATKRREYDEQRSLLGGGGFRFPRPGSGQTNMSAEDMFRAAENGGFGDLLGNLFNQGASGRRQSNRAARRGADVEGEVTIGFHESIEGTTVGVQMTGEDACQACRGTGAKAGTSPRVCPTCQGSGVQQATSGGVFQVAEPCHDCFGRGLVVDDPCDACYGGGRAQSSRRMQVRIPAGVIDGQHIRIKGKGNAGLNGGEAGDLYVTVHVRPHPVFGRNGDHITITVPVTFAEAALGSEVEVPVPDGSTVKLRIPAGTPNGRVFRVRGRGVAKTNEPKGDLLVQVDVQVPPIMSDAARSALEAYVAEVAEPNPRAHLLASRK